MRLIQSRTPRDAGQQFFGALVPLARQSYCGRARIIRVIAQFTLPLALLQVGLFAFASNRDLEDINAGRAWPDINFILGVSPRAEIESHYKSEKADISNSKTPIGEMLVVSTPKGVSGYSFANEVLFAVHYYYPANMYDKVLADVSTTLGPSQETYSPLMKRHLRTWHFRNSVITFGPTNSPEVNVLSHAISGYGSASGNFGSNIGGDAGMQSKGWFGHEESTITSPMSPAMQEIMAPAREGQVYTAEAFLAIAAFMLGGVVVMHFLYWALYSHWALKLGFAVNSLVLVLTWAFAIAGCYFIDSFEYQKVSSEPIRLLILIFCASVVAHSIVPDSEFQKSRRKEIR